MCMYSRLMQNKKYTKTKKNGGIIPAVSDTRTLVVPIKCGECMECRKAKAREWQARLASDIKEHKNGKYVTLTFNTESLRRLKRIALKETKNKLYGYELENKIVKIAVDRMCGRWRKKEGKTLRHWLITELGQERTEHIHIHGIVWTDKSYEEIAEKWKYGNIHEGTYVSERTVNYCIKYVTKIDEKHKYYKSIILCSKGIGANYLKTVGAENNRYKGEKTKEYYRMKDGNKIALTTYWRNKLYTDEEKEKLWIAKLNQNVRYVNGNKIDISKGEEPYWKALKEARITADILGYRNPEINWSEKEEENKRRHYKLTERLK